MTTLIDLVASMLALLIAAAGFIFIFNAKRGSELLKKIGVVALILIFGLTIIQQLAPGLEEAGSLPMLLLFGVASMTAYFIRKARQRKTSNGSGKSRRGEERTPLMPHHFNDDGH